MTTKGVETAKPKVSQKDDEARRVKELREVIDVLRIRELNITEQMIIGYYPPEEFSRIASRFKDIFFHALRSRGILYEDFLRMMTEHEKKERDETGEEYTTAFWQLFWVRTTVEY